MSNQRSVLIRQGFFAGLLGFTTVAAWFAGLNLSAGRSPLFTANVLGSVLLQEPLDVALQSIDLTRVVVYSALHLITFLALGLIAAWLVALAARGMQLWYVSLFVVIFVTFHLFGAVQVFAAPVQAVLSATMIWGAGIAASIVMTAYLQWRHPEVRARQQW